MSLPKMILWITAVLITGAICAYSAMAAPNDPASGYMQLTPVEIAPQQTPMTQNGMSLLENRENSHHEHLAIREQKQPDQMVAKNSHHKEHRSQVAKAERPDQLNAALHKVNKDPEAFKAYKEDLEF